MKINKELISKLEKLAKLDLSDEEKVKLSSDLESILQMIEKLNELNTDGVEPLAQLVPAYNIMREDEIKDEIDRKDALKNAPATDGKHFLVPKMIKK